MKYLEMIKCMVSSGKEEISLGYIRALVIVAGKSELKICQYIKKNLRLKIKIVNNSNSSITEFLNNNDNKTFEEFIKAYIVNDYNDGDLNVISGFKIFILSDLNVFDNEVDKQRFLNKELFTGHWAYEYITPIYFKGSMKEIVSECGIDYRVKCSGKIEREYIEIFPIKDKFNFEISGRDEISIINKGLFENKKTNLNILLDYCLDLEI